MAFLSAAPLLGKAPLLRQPSSAPRPHRAARTSPLPPPRAALPSTPTDPAPATLQAAPIPGSKQLAAAQAITAAREAFAAGRTRVFIELDLTAGDATYTILKSTLPLLRLLTPLFSDDVGDDGNGNGNGSGSGPDGSGQDGGVAQRRIHVLLPDAGAAALARRDWADAPAHVVLAGIEEGGEELRGAAGVFIVAPRASEVERFARVMNQLDGVSDGDGDGDGNKVRVAVVNPDLVNMGVTGLSLNARRLRESLIDTFEQAYCLKTFGWGVMLRAFPGGWGVWVDDEGSDVGFRLVACEEERPGGDRVDEILEGEGGGGGVFDKLMRFLSMYMKG